MSEEEITFLDSIQPIQSHVLGLASQAGHTPLKLELGQRQGATDYIDFIQPEELSAPVMYGIDCKQRPFISLLLQHEDGKEFVITAFQRYSEEPRKWCVGGPDHWNYFEHNTRSIIEKLQILFRGDPLASQNKDDSIRLTKAHPQGKEI